MAAVTKSRPAKTKPDKDKTAEAKPAKVAKKSPAWKELPDADLAAHLLARQTVPDFAWKDRAGGKTRDKGESRAAFIARALGVEEAS